MIENNIDRDGQYYETSALYSHHTRYLYMDIAEILHNYTDAAHRLGIRLFDHPKFRAFYTMPQSRVTIFGHLATWGDDAPDLTFLDKSDPVASADINYLERLIALCFDSDGQNRLGRLLQSVTHNDIEKSRSATGGVDGEWLLFHARNLNEFLNNGATPPATAVIHPMTSASLTASDLLTQKGIAILRSDSSHTAVTMRFGPTLNHGHFDEMGVNFYAMGRQLSYDLGYGLGSTHTQVGWAKQTAAHNTVVVDETSQLKDAGTGGSLQLFADLPGLKLVQADDPDAYSSQGLKNYARTLALIDSSSDSSYLVDIFRVSGGKKHDYVLHFAGSKVDVSGIHLSEPARGSVAGEKIDWGNRQGVDGDIVGYPNKPYWNPPPGNGYGFLVHPRSSGIICSAHTEGMPPVADALFTATWDIDAAAPTTRETQPTSQEAKSHVRVHVMPGVASQIVTADAPGILPKFPRAAWLLARRECDVLSSTFASVQEAYGDAPVIAEVTPLSDPISDCISPLAIKVSLKTGRTDYVIQSVDGQPHEFCDGKRTFSSDASFARFSVDDHGVVDLCVCDGTVASINGMRVELSTRAYTGQIIHIDRSFNTLQTFDTIPLGDALANQFIIVKNPTYSRDTCYRIASVGIAGGGGSLIQLAPTNTLLAKGHMNAPPLDDHTLVNTVPLEYAKSLTKHSTLFFHGKLLTSGGSTTHVREVHGATGTTIAVESTAGFKPNDDLLIYDIQNGDRFTIPCFASVHRKKDGEFEVRTNSALTVSTGKSTALFGPSAAGRLYQPK